MATWVKFGRGKKWHLVAAQWHYRPITRCDRRIADKAEYRDTRPAQEIEACWNCLNGVAWEDFAPQRVEQPFRRYVLARPIPLPPPAPVKLGKKCAHLWVASPFDRRFARCAICGLHTGAAQGA